MEITEKGKALIQEFLRGEEIIEETVRKLLTLNPTREWIDYVHDLVWNYLLGDHKQLTQFAD